MQKWEYIILTARWEDAWRIADVQGQEVSDLKLGDSMSESLNSLGGQGWEMVSMQYQWAFNEGYRIAMKRAKG